MCPGCMMSKQPFVMTILSPLERAALTRLISLSSSTTPKPCCSRLSRAPASSNSLTVDVPSFPTTTPAAAFESRQASSMEAPAASDAARTPITVSPAPVTS